MTLEHDLLKLARDAMRSLMNGREFATGQTGYYLNIIRRIEDELSRSEKTQQWGNPKYLIEEAVLAERQACIDIVELYRIPVGNSPQGELAAGWTYAALHEIRDEIKQRGEK